MLGPLPQSSLWQKTLFNNDVVVAYPPGAGGVWLHCVIGCCTTKTSWQQQLINFHQSTINTIRYMHDHVPVDHVLSISDTGCKYNFWILYVFKRLVCELDYTRERHQRLPLSPYNDCLTNRDHFFSVLNQCRYIQSYQWSGKFEVKWRNLFENPGQAWATICEFLDFNQQKNHYAFDDFAIVLDNYKNTCTHIGPKINFNQKYFLLWALAYLRHQQIDAPFDVFESFGTNIMLDWVKSYEEDIIEFTQSSMYSYSK